MEAQDPSKKHFIVSLIKSLVRILAGIALAIGNLPLAGTLFVSAEMLGIIEEL